MSFSVVMIGAGNLAVNLSLALASKGCQILQVYSRSEHSASSLAGRLNTSWTTSPAAIEKNADFYFIAINDDAIVKFLQEACLTDKLLVHCSGSQSISILEPFSVNRGVLYPLQTLSKERVLDFAEIPLFIEAGSSHVKAVLFEIAGMISSKVQMADSCQRRVLHISAVFACNFVNHCYAVASRLLVENDMEFSVLYPLITETCMKATQIPPEQAQTGPAVRNDTKIINMHLSMLEKYPVFRSLYENLSRSISILPPN